jgi:hypothetical protein
MTIGAVSGSIPGGLSLYAGSSTQSGTIEFTKPGNTSDRHGYIGAAGTVGIIALSANTSGGYYNFVNQNGALEPKINGNTIWHSGNFTPNQSTGPTSSYLVKDGSNGRYSLDNWLTVTGNITATSGLIAQGGLLVGGTGAITGGLTVGGATLLQVLTAAGAMTASSTLTVTGAATLNGATTINGALTTKAISADSIFVTGQIGTNSQFVVNGYNGNPNIRMYRDGTTNRYIEVNSLSEIQFGDNSRNGTHYFRTDGSIFTSQFGDLKGYIDSKQGASLGFTPVRQGGGNGQVNNTVYLGWDGGGLKAQVDSTDLGRIFTTASVNPLIDLRWITAGELDVNWPNGIGIETGMYEPYGGGVITGYRSDGSRYYRLKWRYLQKQDYYGNWYTIGYAN